MKYYLLVILNITLICGAFAQTDTLIGFLSPESILNAGVKTKELSIDLSNPEEVDIVLKKIHTFRYLEAVTFEGENDGNSLNKILYRLSVLKNLKSITLRDNALVKIPENINGLKALESLTIEGNAALDYNDLCNKLISTRITELNLLDNGLKENPATLSKITSLKKIKITGSNQLNYIQLFDELAKLPGLNTLAIPVNFLTEIPENITKLKALQVLDVSDNILTELPDGLSSLKAINNLSIQGNLLLNPAKDLEKLKGNDIRFLSIDKEVSGQDVEQIKKMFPNAEISFPVESPDNETEETAEKQTQELPPLVQKGELKAKKERKILSGAYLLYPSLFRGLVYNFDTLRFEERFTNLNYTNVYQRLRNGQSIGGQFAFDHNFIYHRRNWKPGQKWFRIPDYFSWISTNYPELRAFSGMYWIYEGDLSYKKFKKKILKKTWSDIRIEYDKNNSMFTIHLKSPTGFEKFNAYPLISKNTPLERTQQTYVRRFLLYEKALTRRTEQFRRNQKRERTRYDSNFKKMQNYAWKELQLTMSNEEKLMSREDWLEYYDNIVANEKAAIDNASLSLAFLIRRLAVDNFNAVGTTWSGTGYRMNNINVDFVDMKGSGKLAVTNILTIDTKNKLFSQLNGSLGLTPNLVSVKQFSSYLILVELRNGNFGVVTSDEIDRQSFLNNQTFEFKVKVLDKNLNTIGDLLQEAGLK